MPFDPAPRANGALVDLGPADRLRAAGLVVWPPEAVEKHQRDYIRRHHKLTLVAQWLNKHPHMDFVPELATFIAGVFSSFAFLPFGWWSSVGVVAAVLAVLVINRVLAKALRYQWWESFIYWGAQTFERNDSQRYGAIPMPALRIVDSACVSLGSDATALRVLYCGADPILQVCVDERWFTLAVWDELPNGEFRMLTPPTVGAR